jgi:NAD(P)-dependent dehydrogenase (short-subunit alcohol dehydrogenase family)
MGQVQDKVAIVTGGASGIGAACADLLAREGAKVIVTDLDDGRGAATADDIRRSGGQAVYHHHDVTDEAGWPAVIAAAERFGRLGILVANAGIFVPGQITDISLADWRRVTAVNIDGVFLAVKYALPAMRRGGGGSIIIMSSLAGLRGYPGLAAYCASKGAVRLFAKAVAMECAAAGDNIRVNSVHPGIIDTPIWPADADVHARAKAVVPMARAGEAQDIARGVLFLASDAASYMTGAELVLDGGMFGGTVPARP